ncbi:hypothetical protein N7445_002510 [Penicillium cf. griseofulvum]|nr:hypothetical protein N7445_002510 [Penicillium cf. griseofulvum]
MDNNRLIQCQGDNLAYIKHLELRIIELESDCSSRDSEPLAIQQLSRQRRPCEVCRNINHCTQIVGTSEETSASVLLASESDHDNQSSQNRPRWSTFIPYEPPVTTKSLLTTDPSTLTDSAKQQWNRLAKFASSLSDLAKTSQWERWTSTGEDQRKNIVFDLVSGLAFRNGGNPIEQELSELQIILKEYSSSMQPASAEKRPFACFKELLYCSICAVSLEIFPHEFVFRTMQSVFQSDAGRKTLRTRIHAVNQVNFYRQFNDYSIAPDELIQRVKIEGNPEDAQSISIPLAIPSIIRTIFRDIVPLEKICEWLGYEFDDYNKLDLSGLEKLLVVSASTDPNDTEPNYAGPKDTTSNHTPPNDTTSSYTTASKKRKNGPHNTLSKRRCRDVLSGLPEGRTP